ncbi:RRXRR protein [Ectothiorhodospira magna]|uniref:RRXRR protein n=1 Tax=Ectothiorhodospira magna TaxID=867345 RepID=A0A1H9DU30_9GAMM|nr:RRXRR domain-containing protein [Ectothiorhodospira magna]SEQ16942.1 RRXRR protein [Ectothiorhodospira magna]
MAILVLDKRKKPLMPCSEKRARLLLERDRATGLPVITSSGGRTKYNRQRLGIPKTHALDAACVGPVTATTPGMCPP